MPAGVRRGRLQKVRRSAAPQPHGWLSLHLAIPIPALPDGPIKHKIIGPLDLTVTPATQVLSVTRAALSTQLSERADLSPEMALRVEKAFGVSKETLMRMQNGYDIA